MPDKSARALLFAARSILSEIPAHHLPRAQLKARGELLKELDQLLVHNEEAVCALAAEIREQWCNEAAVQVEEEPFLRVDADGLWISGWLLVRPLKAALTSAVFDAALASLPVTTREVYLLRRVDGRSFGDIAVRLGLSLAEIERLFFESLRGLHHFVHGEGQGDLLIP